MQQNKLGGYQYEEKNEQGRAQRADLITIFVPGTNCGNCIFMDRVSGFCRHTAVQLPVNDKMCCKFWKNPNQINSWE